MLTVNQHSLLKFTIKTGPNDQAFQTTLLSYKVILQLTSKCLDMLLC